MPFPSTACLVQHQIGAKNAFAFDISAGCSGFLYALSIADQYIKTNICKYVLVIGAETLSRVTDWHDRNTCILFSDGAGAVVLGAREHEDKGILSTHLFSDGTFNELLQIPGGGAKLPPTHETIDKHKHFITMKGNNIFKIAINSLFKAGIIALQNNK